MNLDNLFSMLPQQFIEELKNQRRDFLSFDVAKELDAAAFKLADKTKKAERLIVYLNIQLQHYLSKIESNGDLNFVPSAHFNEDHSKLRLCFNLSLDFSRLQYCLKLSAIN